MNKTRDMIIVALFAALTAIGAFIRIPLPVVPFTLQFLFCAYSGSLLGAKLGVMSQLLYVLIGLAGIPIFTNGGGITYIFQPTFGYLIGFIVCSGIIGYFTQRMVQFSFLKMVVAVLAGLAAVYMIGVLYLFMIVNFYMGGNMSAAGALTVGFLPYILPDLMISCLVAYSSTIIIPRLRRNGFLIRQRR